MTDSKQEKVCHICGTVNRSSEICSAWHPDDALRAQVATLQARVVELERELEREWIKNGELLEIIEGLKDRLPPAPEKQ